MNKKWLIPCFTTILFILLLSSCNKYKIQNPTNNITSPSQVSPVQQGDIKNNDSNVSPTNTSTINITVGTCEWDPYTVDADEGLTGFIHDLNVAVFKDMGVNATIKLMELDKRDSAVMSGEIDASFSNNKSPEKASKCYLSDEILYNPKYCLFIKKSNANNLKYNTLNDLLGKKVGLISGNEYPPELIEFVTKNNLSKYSESFDANFKNLLDGAVDYSLFEYENCVSYLQYHKLDTTIIALNNAVYRSPVYTIFNKQKVSEDFVKRYNEQLKQFKKSSGYDKLVKKYKMSL